VTIRAGTRLGSYEIISPLGAGGMGEVYRATDTRLERTVDYALQIARGLSAAHEKGIVHRDLKPENLFVTKDGHLKILDFGLAKRTEQEKTGDETSAPTESKHTEPGTVMGTVGYMSPEQVRGLPVDHRSDIFSFGAILYELLSGKKAFKTVALQKDRHGSRGPEAHRCPALRKPRSCRGRLLRRRDDGRSEEQARGALRPPGHRERQLRPVQGDDEASRTGSEGAGGRPPPCRQGPLAEVGSVKPHPGDAGTGRRWGR
jgi:hypothetical protein